MVVILRRRSLSTFTIKTIPTTPSTKTLDEYVDLFINFKLKVIEAENTGLDTMPSFINELAGYRTQLANRILLIELPKKKNVAKSMNV